MHSPAHSKILQKKQNLQYTTTTSLYLAVRRGHPHVLLDELVKSLKGDVQLSRPLKLGKVRDEELWLGQRRSQRLLSPQHHASSEQRGSEMAIVEMAQSCRMLMGK